MTPTPTPRRLTDLLDPPFMARLDAMDVLSRKMLVGKLQGERRSKRRGQSVEFADHRPYTVGDDLRFVDWNIYGRLDQLFLKLFLEEQDLTVHVLLDTSASQSIGEPSKDTFCRKLAAALTYVALARLNRVTLSTFADGLTGQLADMRGRRWLSQMAEFLLAGRAEGVSCFDKACKQLARQRRGTGVVVVLSDFLFKEGYEEGLRRLIGRQYDVYAIQVLSDEEWAPPLTGDLRLLDVEDEDVSEITVSPVLLDYYRRNVRAYCKQLDEFCTRRGARCVLARSSQSVETLVLTVLRKAGLLG